MSLDLDAGLPLAIDERTGACIWPRRHYPSADEALAAHEEEMGGGWDPDLGPDLEPYGLRRVRLVWAWPSVMQDYPGMWCWGPRGDGSGAIECWEIS